MSKTKSHSEIFTTGSTFDQVYFIDNFYDNINIEHSSELELTNIIELIISAKNDYVKRSGFKLLLELTLTHTINNPYILLSKLPAFLRSGQPLNQAIALKSIPYFEECRTETLKKEIIDLSDSPNGDVSSQAYFCLGLIQLSDSLTPSSLPDVIKSLDVAKAHFQAAYQSSENRVDAEFYLSSIAFFKSVF